MRLQNKWKLEDTLTVLILLTFLTLSNVKLFKMYQSVALYIALLFCFFSILQCKRLFSANLVYIAIFIMYLVFEIAVRGSGVGAMGGMVIPIVMLLSFSKMEFSASFIQKMFAVSCAAMIGLFFFSFVCRNDWNQFYLTQINPNTLAMFMMYAFMIVCVCSSFESKESKLGICVFFVAAVLAIINYSARSALLGLCCFVIMLVIPGKFYNRKSILSIAFVTIIVGVAIPFVYVQLHNSGYDITIMGKSLYTGRQSVWADMFSQLSGSVRKTLFGIGSNVLLGAKNESAHNNYYYVVVSYGIVGFALYYGFVVLQIWKSSRYIYHRTVRKALIMFVCVALVYGFFEVATFWPVTYALAYWGLIVANSESKKLQRELSTARVLQYDNYAEQVTAVM